MKELYKVLKDHKNDCVQELVRASYQHCYDEETRDLFEDVVLDSQEVQECGTENVVRVTLVNRKFEASLTTSVAKLIEAKLNIDKFGFSTLVGELSPTRQVDQKENKRFSNSITVLVNDIVLAMEKLDYVTYRGKVYKKDDRSKYTFSYKCEARAFINTLVTNEFFKSRLIAEKNKVIELLADPLGELFRPLVIDYDLIEVNNGKCWSLKNRSFVDAAIEEFQVGKLSPRAFCPYDAAKEPEPKYFREILENSLSEDDLGRFCEDFLKLLRYNKKRHKDKVPCLVGDADSGKTSLFFPILGLVHHGNVATVTKQRAFNKAMISPFTEVIFLDEATEKTLDIDDWKTLTQGGYAAYDVKYQTARSFINKCPMIITSQRKLDFGPEDQPAMDRRLTTYHFKTLPNPNKKAAAWLKRNPMDCVLWAAKKADAFLLGHRSSQQNSNTSDDEESDVGDGILREDEKQDIRSLSLTDMLDADGSATASEEGGAQDLTETQASTPPANRVEALEDILKGLRPESLRHRHVFHMLRKEREK